MSRILIFGPGYTAARLAARLARDGWHVDTVGRGDIDDTTHVAALIAGATHILSSVPPAEDGSDPVLARYGATFGQAAWIGYLSSSGVYGDTGGAWVDESAPLLGRRPGRIAADLAWLALGARVFRLPGIYGPGRSALDRVAAGTAHRVDLPGQIFSRVHVDDIAGGVVASFTRGPAGAYNLADDRPAPQNALVETAAAMLGRPLPPLLAPDEARLSGPARAFYAERRRVANGRAKRLLGWTPLYPDWRAGLAAIGAVPPAR
ncbi:SDR family NAD(P)-dependent oxidoreductase [Sphingomonas quercus]|uniref:SDR family NAD(P)-dependent oxidoreductase n=1 Tax=Sphingomonas quercus TaxID=2842451 RepID=A0ABS6BKE5_9SPHN|nr:SDR family NAD(P)-dependent oxidoreductase [Sphingomonas quercus]MBU3078327.1 SDR family NAD(P)-dependent oxidoreductase [Sphingomonas quercus]